MAYLDYRNPIHDVRPPLRWWTVVAWMVGVLGAIVLLVLIVLALMPGSSGRSRETALRVRCASNLRQIWDAAHLYARDHQGQLPPDLLTLCLSGNLPSSVFTCPSQEVRPATGATTQQVIASMLAGDHLSYAWVGGGQTLGSGEWVVIAFDLEDHPPPGSGMYVLFGNGSADFVDGRTAKAIRAQFVAGVRPIRLPATAATAPAASQPGW